MAETLGLDRPDLQQLQTDGYVDINHGLTNGDIDSLFTQFEHVSYTLIHEDPTDRLKNSLEYELDNLGNSKYYFKVSKSGQDNHIEPGRGKMVDDKIVYHFGPKTPEIAIAQAGKLLPAYFLEFFDSSMEAYHQAVRAHRIGARLLGLEHVMHTPNNDPDMERHHLRYLMYDPASKESAKKHFDRSATTLAIAETAPGLHGTPGRNGYRIPLTLAEYTEMCKRFEASPIAHYESIGKFFLGAGYERLRDTIEGLPELPLLLHGVIKYGLSQEVETEWRKALILFGNAHAGNRGYIVPAPDECKISYDLAA